MARTKEFDRTEVLNKAMDVFWKNGFEATSIQDLVDAMGINRGSIYDTFGDKAGLFEATLDHYLADAPSQRLINDCENGDPEGEIESFFQAMVDIGSSPGGNKGCLITNTITELCARDHVMSEKISAGVSRLEEALFTLITRGQEDGSFDNTADARKLARFLLATAQGIRVVTKVEPDRDMLQDIVDTALKSLK